MIQIANNTIENNFNESYLHSRYPPDRKKDLENYFSKHEFNTDNCEKVIQTFIKFLENTELEYSILEYPKYKLPEIISKNNKLIRQHVVESLIDLLKTISNGNLSVHEFINYFIKNHENIKWAMNQWLLATPGVSLEVHEIKDGIPLAFKKWLLERFNIDIGDQVIHRHVISNIGRERLASFGFEVPDMQWSEKYYVDALTLALELADQNKKCKGIYSDGSWIYDTNLYLSKEQSIVAFDFLSNDGLVGHRFPFDPDWLDKEKLQTQINFATRSKTRKALYDSGKYQPTVVGVFYPIDELRAYLNVKS